MIKISSSLLTVFLLLLIPALSFADVFTSQANGDWHDPATWGEVSATPGSNDDVTIRHQVFITSGNAIINSLSIINGGTGNAKLDINGSLSFDVTGNLTLTATNNINDVLLMIRSTSIVTIGGNMKMERSADNVQTNLLQLLMSDSGQLSITGSFDYFYRNGLENALDVQIAGSATFTVAENSSIQLEAGSFFTFDITDNAQATFEKDLMVSNTGGLNASVNVFSGGDLIIDGSLTLNSLAATYESDLTIGAISTVDLNGDLFLTANTDQSANVIMTSTSKLYLGGNINRINNFGSLDMGPDSELYFDGTVAQSVPKELMPSAGNDTFSYSNLIFQNSSVEGLTLDGDLTIQSHMTLTDGIVHTTSSALIIIDDLATVDVGNSSSYIDGPMIKRGSTNGSSFTFPTGDNGIFAPITIDPITDPALEYTAEYSGCPPPALNTLNNPLKVLNSQGYWSLGRNDANPVGNVTLHWDDAEANGINDLASLVVAYYNPISGWYSLGAGTSTGGIGTGVSGSLQNDSGCPPPTIDGLFGFGSTEEGMNVLPVELISFRAYKNNDHSKVLLEWETASEENSDHFIIEKSTDGATFHEIGRVPAAQNSSSIQYYSAEDDEPNKGNNYYRIQQVDQDDIMNFSQLVNVFMTEQEDKPVVYPNPVKDFVNIYSSNLDGQEINIKVLDVTGKCLYANPHLAQVGQIFLNVENMNIKNPGIYFINYEDNGQVYCLKFMKI